MDKKETSFGNDAKKKTGEGERGPMSMGMMRNMMGRMGSDGPWAEMKKAGKSTSQPPPCPA